MNTRLLTFLTGFFSVVFTTNAYCQHSITVNLKKLAEAGVATIPAGTSSNTPVDFYVVVKGNVTSQIGVEAQGPAGITAVVDAAQVVDNAEKTLTKGVFWRIQVGTNSRAAVRRAAVNRNVVAADCTNLPEYLVDMLMAAAYTSLGRPATRADVCTSGSASGSGEVDLPSGFSNDIPAQPQIDQSYGAATGFLQKDNCSKVKNYLVRIRVSLSNVAPEILAQGFQVGARIQEAEYKGGRAASLKPVSDGMYAPRPLLLMQSLGGSQWINLVSWSKKKPKILKKVSTSSSMVYYRGYVLTRTVADSLLSGGRGEKVNFEATNGESIYNVCGKRAKVRWRVNGYPG